MKASFFAVLISVVIFVRAAPTPQDDSGGSAPAAGGPLGGITLPDPATLGTTISSIPLDGTTIGGLTGTNTGTGDGTAGGIPVDGTTLGTSGTDSTGADGAAPRSVKRQIPNPVGTVVSNAGTLSGVSGAVGALGSVENTAGQLTGGGSGTGGTGTGGAGTDGTADDAGAEGSA